MEAKRRALEEIAARQNEADQKRKEAGLHAGEDGFTGPIPRRMLNGGSRLR